MHCTNCGTLLEDNAKFCQSCGAPVKKPAPAPAPQPEPIPQPAPVPQPEPIPQPAPVPQPAPIPQPAPAPQQNPYSQADFQQTPYGQQNGQQPFGQSAPVDKPLPMKWYKFVIYVQLFLAAVISLGNAVLYITGIIGASVFDASTFSTVGGLIILLILNIIYFNKRKHLFVN